MPYFNIVAQTTENTVVTEYEPVKARSDSYQSEAELEREFIRMLTEQGYEYLQIHTEAELIANLRAQIEKLNGYTFTDSEWKRFLSESLANPTEHIIRGINGTELVELVLKYYSQLSEKYQKMIPLKMVYIPVTLDPDSN